MDEDGDLFRFSHLTLSKGLEMVKTHVICHMFSNFIDLADVGRKLGKNGQ